MWDTLRIEPSHLKDLIWIASSLRDLKDFPEPVQKVMGFALLQAQCGGRHAQAKPFNTKGGGVVEMVEDYDTDTYRVVYTARFGDELYVPHSFQKKSKSGIKTPKPDVDVIESRLKIAARLHAERAKQEKGK
ncbi:MAG: type II toxin-antitoxin system RelE/ParE family toxin [Coriobacteriia bacterium]